MKKYYCKETWIIQTDNYYSFKTNFRDFPGGTVVKNPTANAGDTGLIPGPGGSHMLQSN